MNKDRVNKKVSFRVTGDELIEVSKLVDVSGLSRSSYLRRVCFGRRIVPKVDAVKISELMKIYGLMKLAHNKASDKNRLRTSESMALIKELITHLG